MSSIIHSLKYDIFLGNDTFYQLGKFLSRNNYSRKFILVDENTKEHCLPLLQRGLLSLQDAIVLEIKAGEASKRIDTILRLWKELTEHGADRHAVLINIGGGVVVDVGGFTAATYMRGIDFINIPTSLLAMVDASVGGKNGINFEGLKNHIGTFDNPQAVFVSPVFLKTLAEAEIRCGFAEVIKHALISDHHKWDAIKNTENFADVNWFEIIKESIWTKNKIVNSDYRDRHKRKTLNFGHTIGHALETYSMKHHSTPLKHGEAVAIGIIGETWLSQKVASFNNDDAKDVINLIKKLYPMPIDFNSDELLGIMRNDKKNHSAKINVVLLNRLGHADVGHTPEEADIKQALEFSKEQLMSPSVA
jgi:3-dehydroquinate synthase